MNLTLLWHKKHTRRTFQPVFFVCLQTTKKWSDTYINVQTCVCDVHFLNLLGRFIFGFETLHIVEDKCHFFQYYVKLLFFYILRIVLFIFQRKDPLLCAGFNLFIIYQIHYLFHLITFLLDLFLITYF